VNGNRFRANRMADSEFMIVQAVCVLSDQIQKFTEAVRSHIESAAFHPPFNLLS
jgi:hypothetical protein